MSTLGARIKDTVLTAEPFYRVYLTWKGARRRPSGRPHNVKENAVLQARAEWEQAVQEVRSLGLPPHRHLPKNWDSVIALACILDRTARAALILDAGAELYSAILPWLYLYGYRNLTGINLAFARPVRRGPIRYIYGDVTRTDFQENTFDAITCLSVIEHGVDVHAFFREMSRILKPKGILVVSTDYYPQFINTRGLEAYGTPIRIFSRDEIEPAISAAETFGFSLTGPLDLNCKEKAVRWEKFGLDYTFLIMCFVLGHGKREQRENGSAS
jgi:SAM-dependent methyltransferase